MLSHHKPSFGNGNEGIPTVASEASKNRLIIWCTPDSAYARKMYWKSLLNDTAMGELMFLPCFWPHALVMCLGPHSCFEASSISRNQQATYWLVTDEELLIVSLEHPTSCFSCGCQSPREVKNIQWSEITTVEYTVDISCCVSGLKTLTISLVTGHRHDLVGVNHNCTIRDSILSRISQGDSTGTDVLNGNGGSDGIAMTDINQLDGEPTAENRFEVLHDLREMGYITDEEFERKRQEIIESV